MYLGIDKHYENNRCPAGKGCTFKVESPGTAYDGAKVPEAMNLWMETMDVQDMAKRERLASSGHFVNDGTKVLIDTESASISAREGGSLKNLKNHSGPEDICFYCQLLAQTCLGAHVFSEI